MIRLNKYLADCGVASRRGADKLITENRIKVNGVVVNALGSVINPVNDTVMFDSQILKPATTGVYIMLNKPKSCLTSVKDDRGRKTVMDYVQVDQRVYPVGRLDYESEGLVLLTNDGELALKLTHPSNEIGKTYSIKVEGEIKESELATLRKGVLVDGVKTKKCKVRVVEYKDKISKLEMTIFEGRNRQIRKMFEAIDRNVIFLKRVAVGDLRLGGLSRGTFRYLNDYEIAYLKSL